jgi:hypothetical protein
MSPQQISRFYISSDSNAFATSKICSHNVCEISYKGMDCINQVQKNPVLDTCECDDEHLGYLRGRIYLV